MTVTISKPALNIREQFKKLARLIKQPPFQTFEFEGTGSQTDFEISAGWKPLAVYDAGSRQTEGSGDDFTVTSDGFVYTVVFAVAPTNLNVILIDGWRL